MNWIHVSLIFLCSSVCLYLFVRNSDKFDIPLEIKNLVMFASPILPLFLYIQHTPNRILIEEKYILILFFASVFFAWLASKASLIAIKEAPNQGYSLIISKSYVVYTTLFSFFFLSSDLSYFKIIIILLILFFSGCILYEKKSHKSTNGKRWIWLSLYAFFAWGSLALTFTWLGGEGISASILNIYILTFSTCFILGEILFKKIKYIPKSKPELITLVAIGISFIIFQQSGVTALILSPNPGYVNAINIGSIGIVTLLSGFIFKDDLTNRKILGVIGVIFCIFLLFI